MSPSIAEEYQRDFYAWLIHNAQLLRQGRWSEIDVENVAEELDSMGRSERRELVSRLAVLLAHLLKWVYQPEKRSHSWKYTIEEQRQQVWEVLADSPSLKSQLEEKFLRAYQLATVMAAKETGLAKTHFPSRCPFSLEQTLDDGFYPEAQF